MIRTRLIWGNALVFAVVLTLIGTVVYVTTSASMYRAVDSDLVSRAAFLQQIGRRGPPGGGPDEPGGPPRQPGERPQPPREFFQNSANYDPVQAKRLEFQAELTRPRMFHRGRQPEGMPGDTPLDRRGMALGLAGQTLFSDLTLMGHHVRVLSVPLNAGNRVEGAAQFASNLDDIDAAVVRLRNVLLAMLPLALAITWLLGIWLTLRSLRPVRAITEAAERIEATRLDDRLPVHGTDEFAVLSTRFNSMLGRIQASFKRLEDAYDAQRRFVADASHELKTPLTTVKGRVGVAGRGPQTPERYAEHMAAIGRAADNMSAIIQDLLLLASSDESRLTLHRSSQPLRELAESAVKATPTGKRAPIGVEIPDEMTVDVDPELFVRALGNLLGNAVRHTPKDKSVTVRASAQEDAVCIEVVDEGEGIPPEHLPRVFDRFHRVDASRERGSGGTGLGLAIVRSIVEAHAGSVSIASTPAQGTTVTILLPSGPQI